ncbi:hypothetical protein LMG28138_05905 [Pararobbsia alpina]|uniref:Uncharacterized protein n=2 Tax=Pararobbsia alpina TaxID=621374 RepID=A0A6S7BXN0_9BURK|nr:hypothetical protein LMG28138_05905 [Pararobbsia alpina]
MLSPGSRFMARRAEWVTLKFYDPPNAFQKLTKAEPNIRQSVLIPVDDIKSIAGTSLPPKFELSDSELWLARYGSLSSRGDSESRHPNGEYVSSTLVCRRMLEGGYAEK